MAVTTNLKMTLKSKDGRLTYTDLVHDSSDEKLLAFAKAVNSLRSEPADKFIKTVEEELL